MPVSAARGGIGGHPPFALGAADDSSGSTINHSESGTSGLGIPPHESTRTRVQGFERHSYGPDCRLEIGQR